MSDERKTMIQVNGEAHEVETKPLTLLFHPDNVKLDVEGTFEIAPDRTVKAADALELSVWLELRATDGFRELWDCVFDFEPPMQIAGEGLGVRHVIGLILMLWYANSMELKPLVRFPETYLHPKAQCGLADLFIKLYGR